MIFSFFFYLAILLALFGFTIFWPAWKARKQDQRLDVWPSETGSIIAVDTQKVEPEASKSAAGKPLYNVAVRYQFRALGQMRFGNTVTPERRLYDEAEVQRLVDRYKPGASVRLYYNPEDPVVSFLEKPKTTSQRNVTIGGALIGLAVVCFLLNFLIG